MGISAKTGVYCSLGIILEYWDLIIVLFSAVLCDLFLIPAEGNHENPHKDVQRGIYKMKPGT